MNNLLTRNRTTVLKMKAILMVCLMGVFTVSRFTMHYSLQIQCLHFQLFVFVVIELLLCFVLKNKGRDFYFAGLSLRCRTTFYIGILLIVCVHMRRGVCMCMCAGVCMCVVLEGRMGVYF